MTFDRLQYVCVTRYNKVSSLAVQSYSSTKTIFPYHHHDRLNNDKFAYDNDYNCMKNFSESDS